MNLRGPFGFVWSHLRREGRLSGVTSGRSRSTQWVLSGCRVDGVSRTSLTCSTVDRTYTSEVRLSSVPLAPNRWIGTFYLVKSIICLRSSFPTLLDPSSRTPEQVIREGTDCRWPWEVYRLPTLVSCGHGSRDRVPCPESVIKVLLRLLRRWSLERLTSSRSQ